MPRRWSRRRSPAHGRLDGVLVASGMNHVAADHRDGRRGLRAGDGRERARAPGWCARRPGGCSSSRARAAASCWSRRSRAARAPGRLQRLLPVEGGGGPARQDAGGRVGRAGIRVNALAPTVFRSELTAWMYADDEKGRATREAMFARIPLRRFAEPEDFVGALSLSAQRRVGLLHRPGDVPGRRIHRMLTADQAARSASPCRRRRRRAHGSSHRRRAGCRRAWTS